MKTITALERRKKGEMGNPDITFIFCNNNGRWVVVIKGKDYDNQFQAIRMAVDQYEKFANSLLLECDHPEDWNIGTSLNLTIGKLTRNRDVFPSDFRPTFFGKETMIIEDLHGHEYVISGYKKIDYEFLEEK